MNVHPFLCKSAEFTVFIGLWVPIDRIMGLNAPCGGQLSHAYEKKVWSDFDFL